MEQRRCSTPGMTTLVLSINPDSGRSSPTTFRPEAVYAALAGSRAGREPRT
jgi:hypothetical protein